MSTEIFVWNGWAGVADGETVYGGKVYKIGVNAFGSVDDALGAVAENGTITLLADLDADGAKVATTYGEAITCTTEPAANITIVGETDGAGNNLITQTGLVKLGGAESAFNNGISISNINFKLPAENSDDLFYIAGVHGLQFTNCGFSAENGGDIFQSAKNGNVRNKNISFDYCTFENGRVYLQRIVGTSAEDYGAKITNSVFNDAKVSVDSANYVTISGCEFNNDISKTEFAVYVGSATNTQINVTGNKFNITGGANATNLAYVIGLNSTASSGIVVSNNIFTGSEDMIGNANANIYLEGKVPANATTMTGNDFGVTDDADILALIEAKGEVNLNGTVGFKADECLYVPGNATESEKLVYFEESSVFVNADWAGKNIGDVVELTDTVKLTYGTDAFGSVKEATDSMVVARTVASQIVVVASSLDNQFGTSLFAGFTGKILGGHFSKSVSGGILGGEETLERDINLSIAGGTFEKSVSGGDVAASGSLDHYGNINLNISGGTFNSTVNGGMLLTSTAIRHNVYSGNVNMTISGGMFGKRVYAGNMAANSSVASRAYVDGYAALTIDVSKNVITFNDCVHVGSYSVGFVTGDATVTVTGSGDNLEFTQILSGGSGNAYYYYDNEGKRQFENYIDGDSKVVFDNFSGKFGAQIKVFDSISFKDSAVQFTNASANLADVANWEFDTDSVVTDLASNDFTGDKLNIDLTGWDREAVTLMSGSENAFTGFESLSSVAFNGVSEGVAWDGSAWCSSEYKLALSDDRKSMIVSLAQQLA